MRIIFACLFVTAILASCCFGQEDPAKSLCSAISDEVFAKPTKLIQPKYLPAAAAVRATGDVAVLVIVSPEGRVRTTSVQNGHPLLRKAAEIAASQTTFVPIKGNCDRVATLTFTFLTGPPQSADPATNPFHVQIFAQERPVRNLGVGGKDPCKDLRFMPLGGDAPTLSMKEAMEFPNCVEDKLVRLYGIYRVAFENSDYYDPDGTGSAWLEFSPFYTLTKKCSSPGTLNLLDSKNGGTFGLVGNSKNRWPLRTHEWLG